MAIPDEFRIERHGKTYILFAGLLAEAHNRNLKSVETEIIEYKFADGKNGLEPQYAIVKATVTMEDGGSYQGIGDATLSNVGGGIKPHLIRMAETRSVARALRLATNIGVTSLEEMGGEDEASGNGHRPASQGRSQEHERLLEEIAVKYEEMPGVNRPNKSKLFDYASSKIGNARAALQDLTTRLEESLSKHGGEAGEETQEAGGS